DGATYTVSVLASNDTASSITVLLDWCDTPTAGGSAYTIAPGETKRIYLTSSRATYTSTYRFFDIQLGSAVGTSVLINDVLIEAGARQGEFFDKDTPDAGDFEYVEGTGGISHQRALGAGVTT